jgi:hypothetical protein
MMVKEPSDHKFCLFLIKKFISSPKINWGKEIKIAKNILKRYDDKRFWSEISIDFKICSLAWFLTNEGKFFVSALQSKWTLANSQKKTYLIQEHKIGEDVEVSRKNKTIKDFLK